MMDREKHIFGALQARCTGMVRLDEFGRSGPWIELACDTTGETRPGLDRNEEWQLTARIDVRFWANRVQFQQARERAERQLATVLYGDFLELIDRAAGAAMDGNRTAVLASLDLMRHKITR